MSCRSVLERPAHTRAIGRILVPPGSSASSGSSPTTSLPGPRSSKGGRARERAVRVPGRQRGRGPSRLRRQRGDRDLPDHARVADGRALRRLGGAPAGRTCGARSPTSSRCSPRPGAAGALHGALQKGALATTFTASQGLLLMVPNMFKICGELTPAVIHVAARTDRHPRPVDLRRPQRRDARPDDGLGDAGRRLGPGGPRLRPGRPRGHAPVARAVPALLRRVPHLARDQQDRASSSDDDIRALVRDEDVLAFRGRGMTPDAPVVRGTAQNPDVFFQAREAANPFHLAVPGIVQEVMDELAARTGRHYGLVDYHGAPDAERVIVRRWARRPARSRRPSTRWSRPARRSACSRIRLFQPFPAEQIIAALPPTVRAIAVLDRTKEPGAVGEPLLPGGRRRPRRGDGPRRAAVRDDRRGSSAAATACRPRR